MAKIIDGVLYERERVPDTWEVRTKRCNGVMERIVRPHYAVIEVGMAPAWMLTPTDPLDPVKDAAFIAEQKEKNLRRAATRAKLACKWAIVHEGFDELLTLTYRENQTDEALAKRHHKEWVRRMKKALPDFRYCTGFEPQERGAWHMHVATHRLPKHALYKGVKIEAWKLGTRIWRDIVGADNGLCFVGGKQSKWGKKTRKRMSLYKMANYVSKYIIKHFELMPEGLNRYSRSNGKPVIEKHVAYLMAPSIADVIGACFEIEVGSMLQSHRLSYFQDFYIVATEIPRSSHFVV